MHHHSSDRDPAFFYFYYFFCFSARQSPVWMSASSKAFSQENTAFNSTEGANLLFPFCSLSLTWISCRHSDEFSPFSFILLRSDRRNTCGIHPSEEKKISSFTFLFFLYFVPPFHRYLAKVKEIFCRCNLSSSVVLCVEPNCHTEIECRDNQGRPNATVMPLTYILTSHSGGGGWGLSVNKT